jgi:PAS domain S-box-containing protein
LKKKSKNKNKSMGNIKNNGIGWQTTIHEMQKTFSDIVKMNSFVYDLNQNLLSSNTISPIEATDLMSSVNEISKLLLENQTKSATNKFLETYINYSDFYAILPIQWEQKTVGFWILTANTENQVAENQYTQQIKLAEFTLKQAIEKTEIKSQCEQTNQQLQKQSEKLHLETLLFDALLEHSSDHVYFKDLESRFIRSSRAQSKLFKLNHPDAAIGKTDFDFFSKEHAQAAWDDEQRIINEGISISKEEKETWPDKPNSWVSTTKAPLRDYNGKIIGTFGISRNITDRVEQEQIIVQQNEELTELNKHKDKLMSIIAHDLRSPFNAFLGLTEILDKQLSSMSPQEIQHMATTIKNSATRIYDLLSNLLEWTRLQRGQIRVTKVEFLLNDVVKQCTEALQEMALDKKIELRTNVAEDFTVLADPNMLQIIIQNLLTNALKFTPERGNVNVKASKTSSGESHITISDTGIGIPETIIDHLFQFDGHTNRPGTRGETSTGLGLLICKEFAEKQGARLWVESRVEKGSSFHLIIP